MTKRTLLQCRPTEARCKGVHQENGINQSMTTLHSSSNSILVQDSQKLTWSEMSEWPVEKSSILLRTWVDSRHSNHTSRKATVIQTARTSWASRFNLLRSKLICTNNNHNNPEVHGKATTSVQTRWGSKRITNDRKQQETTTKVHLLSNNNKWSARK